MKKLLGFLMFLIFTPTLKADLKTSLTFEQAKDDVRVFLKDIYKAQSSYMVEYGNYTTQMDELKQKIGFKIPAHISALGSVRMLVPSPFSLRILFYTQNPVFKNASTGDALPVYEINHQGVLGRLTQWNTIAEVIQEVDLAFHLVENMQKAYYTEFNKYTADWIQLGAILPPYLKNVGTFSLRLLADGNYQLDFLGTRFPLLGYQRSLASSDAPPLPQSCPVDTVKVGVRRDGTLLCPKVFGSCLNGQSLVDVASDGTPICKSGLCPLPTTLTHAQGTNYLRVCSML